jgi:histidinol-phosphate aminotransferase
MSARSAGGSKLATHRGREEGQYRRDYRSVPRFSDGKGSAPVTDLGDNTNLWGPPPAASRAIAAAVADARAYPHPHAAPLLAALAAHVGVSADMLVAGCGSDDVLDSAIRALIEPGGSVASSDPTFPMATVFARTNGLVPMQVPLKSDWQIDVEGLLATEAQLIYVASPNNPTGIATEQKDLERLIARAPGFVILDQAYVEFAGDDDGLTLDLLRANDRLLVIRTLSKAWGLAGLRVGFGIGAPDLVAEVEKARGPYKVNAVAAQAAIAAIRFDKDWVAARVRDAVQNRIRLDEAFRALGCRPLPSDANFLLIPMPAATAARIVAALSAQQISVRHFPALRGIGDALRITVGPWPIMERLLATIGNTLAVTE